MKYRYSGIVPITCYGVRFNPGDIREVPGVINIKNFTEVFEPKNKMNEKPSHKPAQKRSVGRPPKKKTEPNIISNDTLDDVLTEDMKFEITDAEKEKE